RVAAMLLLTLRGTPTMYYGDEIGLARVHIPRARVQDPWEKNEPGLGFGRDPERTPMQWDTSRYAGFSDAEPWLPLSEDHEKVNVETLSADPRSMLTLYRRLIALRRSTPALSVGDYTIIRSQGAAFGFRRNYQDQEIVVLLNLGQQPQTWTMADARSGQILLSTSLDREGETAGPEIRLAADEGVVLTLVAR
ncbi:MAG TPA: DUF3459 domain-containing protein, partial [Enterovirga sp.]|nr:DUF3459 domain-containing protein [Enterovirga sp.]